MNEQIATLMPLIILILVMYFLLIRPQKKREKAITAMRNSIKVGDDITTIGGIIGKVVKIKDDVLTTQVGADKTKFEIMRWAISKVNSDEPTTVRKPKKEEPAEPEKEAAPKKSLPKRLKRAGSSAEGSAAEGSTAKEAPATADESTAAKTEEAKAEDKPEEKTEE